jgi:exodeoxyribonuclease VIII
MDSTFIKSVNIQPFRGTDDEYHSNKDYVSASGLKKLKISPAHFMEEEEMVESEALIFGSAYHMYVLEPDKFEDEYYIFNDNAICQVLIGEGYKSPRSTKAYKEWEESEMRIIGNKKVITKDIFERIQAMRDKLMRHPYAKMLLSGGINEQGYMGEIETESGNIKVKYKPDHINEGKKFIVDLKTAADASIDGFTRASADRDYHIQASFYSDLMEKVSGDNRAYSFFFIAQEKKQPFAFNIFESSPQFISQGRFEYEMLLQLYKYCTENNTWPGYQIWCQNKYGILELKLPPWAIKDLTYYDHYTKVSKQLMN